MQDVLPEPQPLEPGASLFLAVQAFHALAASVGFIGVP